MRESTRPLGDATAHDARSFELTVVAGPGRGAHAVSSTGRATLGSGDGVTLKLEDATVSRIHCELEGTPSGVRLTDAKSTNGTWVEGLRVERAILPSGGLVRLGRCTVRVDVGREVVALPLSDAAAFGELLGSSVAMRRVYALLERVAETDTTVLLTGETGTGKDAAARSLHRASRRSAGPFVAVDAGAIPENLFESELFGHVRGAFTGADALRRGVFEEADGGTLFLDEIGELPLGLQAKLLRVLETKTIRRVGDSKTLPVDVRLVAATNRSLAEAVNDGTFREDLYYRLCVVEVRMPPLRARREDIAALASHFAVALGSTAPLGAAFVDALVGRAYGGNVRELRNVVERALVLGLAHEAASAPPVSTGAPDVRTDLPMKDARKAWDLRFDEVYVKALLQRHEHNVSRAAAAAGVSRRYIQRLMLRLGLREAGEGGRGDGDQGQEPGSK
ncbi:MAG: sigma 54-interacting transcriptional regulator [Myxococcales bacterium]|nr:sigma 54-interacting transcriptional regulator [Myxococcales bacterium]